MLPCEEQEQRRRERMIELAAAQLPAFWRNIRRQVLLEEAFNHRLAALGEITKVIRSEWGKWRLSEAPPTLAITHIDKDPIEPDWACGYLLFEATQPGWVCGYYLVYVPRLYGDLPTVVCDITRQKDTATNRELSSVHRLSEYFSLMRTEHFEQVLSSLETLSTIVKRNNLTTTE